MLDWIKSLFFSEYRTCKNGWHKWLYIGNQEPIDPSICLKTEISRTCDECGVKYTMVGWESRGAQIGPKPIYKKTYINFGDRYVI